MKNKIGFNFINETPSQTICGFSLSLFASQLIKIYYFALSPRLSRQAGAALLLLHMGGGRTFFRAAELTVKFPRLLPTSHY